MFDRKILQNIANQCKYNNLRYSVGLGCWNRRLYKIVEQYLNV